MPSTVTVFKSFKASISSTIHSHRKALRSGSNSKDFKDFEMNEPVNRKPTNGHLNHSDESILAKSLTRHFDSVGRFENGLAARSLDRF